MENAHRPELWHEVYLLLGTATASLVGLFFIATSLHLDDVMKNMILRIRARNVMMAMLLLTIQSIVVLFPQPAWALGAEVIVLGLAIVQFPVTAAMKMQHNQVPIPLSRIGLGIASCVLSIAGGVGLIAQVPWSFYLIGGGNLLLVTVLVANAWSLMLGVWQVENSG